MKDINIQISFICEAVDRILAQIDLDILSPTFGCAHLAYWRDKTSFVADMRCQEVMLTLSLLYLKDYPSSSWKGNERLKVAIEALLSFWCKNQYKDGSMDEWYKGERGFAAAAFSTHAVARTLTLMKDALPEEVVILATKSLEKTACWLMDHNDLFKANHQAVGVAALAWAGKFLQKDAFKDNAYKKLSSVIGVQTKEGWFPEVGHMDIGYTFLAAEFVLMAMDLWGDYRYVEPFQRAFDFACEWIHPDFTVGEEYGVCHNTYISRIAVILMSKFSSRAAFLRERLEDGTVGFKGYSPILADDLRLLRYSFQPLLAYEYAKKTPHTALLKKEVIPLLNPVAQTRVYEEASLVRFSCDECTGIFAPVAGGLIRFFGKKTESNFSDYGYAINSGGGFATNITYNRNIKIEKNEKGFLISSFISDVRKFTPSFWMRVILHLLSITSIGSRITRNVIDIIRKKKGTAINQSCVNLNSSKSAWVLHRRVSIQKDHVEVADKLVFKKPVKSRHVSFLGSTNGYSVKRDPITSRITGVADTVKYLEITKFYYPGEDWSLREVSLNIVDRG